MPTVFSRIISGEIPADVVYRDAHVTAFRDLNPQAPVHVLIVPNREIASVNDLSDSDSDLAGRLMVVAAKLAQELGVADSGYRLIVNCKRDGGQEVPHLHMHLMGGEPLGPMRAVSDD